jgi:hypothetical protein
MRPASIVQFERLYLAALAVALAGDLLSWNGVTAAMQGNPQMAQMGAGFAIGGMVAVYAVMLALWYFAAHRRSVIAKWIIAAWFVINTAALAFMLYRYGVALKLTIVLGWATYLLRAWAVSYLFKPDADAWFAKQ